MSPSDRAVLRPSKTADLAAAIRALHVRRSPSPVFNVSVTQTPYRNLG